MKRELTKLEKFAIQHSLELASRISEYAIAIETSLPDIDDQKNDIVDSIVISSMATFFALKGRDLSLLHKCRYYNIILEALEDHFEDDLRETLEL